MKAILMGLAALSIASAQAPPITRICSGTVADGYVTIFSSTRACWAPTVPPWSTTGGGGGGTGEANTASNQGSQGTGVFYQKSGVDLQFYKLNPVSSRISIVLDATNHKVDFNIDETTLSISASQITGTLTVPNGGTGRAILTNHGVLLGAGISPVSQLAAAAIDTVLMGGGVTNDPSFVALANCANDGSHALVYSTATHSFACATITGGGGGSGITQLTGDVTAGPGTGSVPATLANTAVGPGTYGDSTHVGSFTVDAKGRLTAASSITITGGGGGGGGITVGAALPATCAVGDLYFLNTASAGTSIGTHECIALNIWAMVRPVGGTYLDCTQDANANTVCDVITTPGGIATQTLVSSGQAEYCPGVGTNTITCVNSYLTTLAAGQTLRLNPAANNSGAVTLNPQGLGAKAVTQQNGVTALAAGDLVAGRIISLTYDGTVFRLPAAATAGGGGPTLVASGTSALATSAIASGACASVVTTSATGTLTTDVIAAGFNGDPTAVTGFIPSTNGMLTIIPYPTADNANFKVCNNTAASVTPGALTLNWRVIR